MSFWDGCVSQPNACVPTPVHISWNEVYVQWVDAWLGKPRNRECLTIQETYLYTMSDTVAFASNMYCVILVYLHVILYLAHGRYCQGASGENMLCGLAVSRGSKGLRCGRLKREVICTDAFYMYVHLFAQQVVKWFTDLVICDISNQVVVSKVRIPHKPFAFLFLGCMLVTKKSTWTLIRLSVESASVLCMSNNVTGFVSLYDDVKYRKLTTYTMLLIKQLPSITEQFFWLCSKHCICWKINAIRKWIHSLQLNPFYNVLNFSSFRPVAFIFFISSVGFVRLALH